MTLQLKQGSIEADRECWTLTMQFSIDKSNKTEKQLENIKNEFSTKQTYHGTLEGAIQRYCDSALQIVEPEVEALLKALKGLSEEIQGMDLSNFKRY